MKLAILETGRPPGDLADRFGDYPSMFGEMLGPEFEVESFDVPAGQLPNDAAEHAAYLITGSPAGVYDPQGKLFACFSSIWRQEAPGQWKIVFDRGTGPQECSKP